MDEQPLAPPEVDGARDGAIAAHDGVARLVVRVGPYVGMSAGDEVRLRWDTGILRTSLIDSRLVVATAVGVSTLFHLPWPAPGMVRVSYVVGRADGRWSVSEHMTVTVTE
ncbi:hypothetical protein [Streptomyces sp. UNOB3_S3]|uniref:hypothetical protein n=1 Tax=Streptomyces sp. UNOB3_S3 TaxID=2871682 RepID=UPI001E571042|nr:hypothetical protein [Streptomyces sp. UNOB3_S3]MCC3774681.1 hypothetical protein [Streptomyces sp. UNOB3_S3]